MGGTSVLSGMGYTRGSKGDFDHWVTMGNTGWGRNEVLSYYKKSENLASVSQLVYSNYFV